MSEEQADETPRIDYWDCEDCMLSELETWEMEAHERATDHTIVARYV